MIAALQPTPTWYLILAAILFGIGAVGVLVRRNPLVMFMCIELMLNAVNLSLVTFSRINGNLDGVVMAFFVMVVAAAEVVVALSVRLGNISGQTAVFFVLVVAAAEVVVGLGIIVSIMRRRPQATADELAELKG